MKALTEIAMSIMNEGHLTDTAHIRDQQTVGQETDQISKKKKIHVPSVVNINYKLIEFLEIRCIILKFYK